MKQMLMYRTNGKTNPNGSEGKDLIRVIKVHASFEGIGKRGQINQQSFINLRRDIEPSCNSHEIVDC